MPALIQISEFDQNSSENNNKKFLFDTGVSENGVLHNADVFGINIDKVDGIILSHGHFDHFAGLLNIIKRISSSSSSPKLSGTNYVNIFVHPDAFLRRWEIVPDGKRAKCPILDELQLQELGAQICKTTGITILPSKESPLLLITGQIPRETSFEKGYPFQYVEKEDDNDGNNQKNLVPDPMVKDDQAIVASIRDKGLVILTGCSHAGIINTINYAKRITGVDRVYAVIGGFHLPADGGIYEAAIEPTLYQLQKADPKYIVPCHCTGLKATNKIIEAMPEKFIQSAVGTTFQF